MLKTIIFSVTLTLLPITENVGDDFKEENFSFKEVEDFLYLEDFGSVAAFEDYIKNYEQLCIDHTYINSKTVRCFLSYELWDRELNKYYKKLREELPEEGKKFLLHSQRAWIKNRDLAVNFNSFLLDHHYEGVEGTMFIALRAGDADSDISPLIKQRTLLLKRWIYKLQKKQMREIL